MFNMKSFPRILLHLILIYTKFHVSTLLALHFQKKTLAFEIGVLVTFEKLLGSNVKSRKRNKCIDAIFPFFLESWNNTGIIWFKSITVGEKFPLRKKLHLAFTKQ